MTLVWKFHHKKVRQEADDPGDLSLLLVYRRTQAIKTTYHPPMMKPISTLEYSAALHLSQTKGENIGDGLGNETDAVE